MLVLVIVALQAYFDKIWNEAVYDKVLSVPSEQLQDLRNRDAWNLTHYMYGDLDKSTIGCVFRSTRPRRLFAAEAAAGKMFYPAKATPTKTEEPATPRLRRRGAAPAGAAPPAG